MSSFLEELMESLVRAIPDPGTTCAREVFVIYRPEDISDDEWSALGEELRLAFGQGSGAPSEDASSPGATGGA